MLLLQIRNNGFAANNNVHIFDNNINFLERLKHANKDEKNMLKQNIS